MNSMTARRINGFVPALLIGLAAVGKFAACEASDRPHASPAPMPSITVRYDDVNLASTTGVQQLYARIVAAARQVCDTGGQRTLLQFEQFRACFGPSVTRAVNAVGVPALMAFHASKTGQPQESIAELARR